MRLTKTGCVTLFISANRKEAPPSWEGRSACRSCPLGAEHAGRKPAPPVIDPVLGTTCPRCLRPSAHLVWRRLCPSCDARAGEARRGRNAKGTKPKLMGRLAPRAVTVTVGDTVRLQRIESAIGLIEAWMAIARPLKAPVIFSRPAIDLLALLPR